MQLQTPDLLRFVFCSRQGAGDAVTLCQFTEVTKSVRVEAEFRGLAHRPVRVRAARRHVLAHRWHRSLRIFNRFHIVSGISHARACALEDTPARVLSGALRGTQKGLRSAGVWI